MDHIYKINPGDTITILVADKAGRFVGCELTADSIINNEPKTKRPYNHKSHEAYLSKVISKYCYAIQTGKWVNGTQANVQQAESKLRELLEVQSTACLSNLSPACVKSLKETYGAARDNALCFCLAQAIRLGD